MYKSVKVKIIYRNAKSWFMRKIISALFNTLNAELNPVFHLLALLGAHTILHINKIRVNYFKIEISDCINLHVSQVRCLGLLIISPT
jgi:hypothetical protein